MTHRCAWTLVSLLSALPLTGCLQATEVVLEITTDAECTDLIDTSITSGLLVELEGRPATTITMHCDPDTHRIGSLVVVPRDDNDGQFAVRVVTGVLKDAEACVASGYEGGCIVARRALSFVPHERLVLPIEMQLACLDVPCGVTDTCRDGRCVSANIDDPQHCTEPGGCDAGMSDVDAGDAAAVDAATIDTGVDATTDDAHVDDASMEEAGTDAGFDSGFDAGFDGGTDAGTDAGTDPFEGLAGCMVGDAEHPTIQSALDDEACVNVLVPDGTWHERLTIQRDVTVIGASTAATIIDAEAMDRVVHVIGPTTSTLRRLTLTGGYAREGGGVRSGGTITLAAVRVINNVAAAYNARGAGIMVYAGDLTLTEGTLIAGNRFEPHPQDGLLSAEGGGIYAINAGTLSVGDDVIIEDNGIDIDVDQDGIILIGGGVFIGVGRVLDSVGNGLTIRDNMLNVNNVRLDGGNTDFALGGGLHCENASLRMSNRDVIHSNEIVLGGAASFCNANGGGMSLVSCGASWLRGGVVSDNRVRTTCRNIQGAYGGGIHMVDTQLQITGSTITGNMLDVNNALAADDTCVVKGGGVSAAGSNLIIDTTTIANNEAACTCNDALSWSAGAGVSVTAYDGEGSSVMRIERSTVGPDNRAVAVSPLGNATAEGAGVFVATSASGLTLRVDVENSTITGNTFFVLSHVADAARGAGLALRSSGFANGLDARIYNSTIVRNDASDAMPEAGGIFLDAALGVARFDLVHSIVAANLGQGATADMRCVGGGQISMARANLFTTDYLMTGCVTMAPAGNYIVEPTFVPTALADNGGATFTHALGLTQSGADDGSAMGCVNTEGEPLNVDQRGVTRSGVCDLGSYTLP